MRFERTRKDPLIYSDEFRKAVLKAYPEDPKIKWMLDNNEYILGRYLDDSSCITISVDKVMCLIRSDQIERLYSIAFDIKERSKLYGMWDKEVFLD